MASEGLPLSTEQANFEALQKLYKIDSGSALTKRNLLNLNHTSAITDMRSVNTSQKLMPVPGLDRRQDLFCAPFDSCANPKPAKGNITVNGCGAASETAAGQAFGVFLNTVAPMFESVCNKHDVCFGTCNSGFGHCQQEFAANALAVCFSRDFLSNAVETLCDGSTALTLVECTLSAEAYCGVTALIYTSGIELFVSTHAP